jgi:ATP-binding cassette subfamily F protein 3
LLRELEKLERDLATRQADCGRLDAQLADPGLYVREPAATIERIARERAALAAAIEAAENRWLELHAELEELGAA